MMYAFLMMAMTLLGGIVRLAQALRLSVPLLYGALVITVFRPWYLTHTALADGIFFVLVYCLDSKDTAMNLQDF